MTDEDLLASRETEAFGVFYDRHARTLLGYFARRTQSAEVAADLTAETFASAISAQSATRGAVMPHSDPSRRAAQPPAGDVSCAIAPE